MSGRHSPFSSAQVMFKQACLNELNLIFSGKLHPPIFRLWCSTKRTPIIWPHSHQKGTRGTWTQARGTSLALMTCTGGNMKRPERVLMGHREFEKKKHSCRPWTLFSQYATCIEGIFCTCNRSKISATKKKSSQKSSDPWATCRTSFVLGEMSFYTNFW